MTKRERYFVTRRKKLELTEGMLDLLSRRTRPFLDDIGQRTSIASLLEEVYLQGITDAIDAMDHRDETKDARP